MHWRPNPERSNRISTAPRSPEDDRANALALLDVSRETEQRLATYVELLRKWQTIKNLVSEGTLDEIWTRHIADSAQVLPLAPGASVWADMGSGAGFPGLVIAILLREEDGALVHLIESNNRKCAFLREVARETGAHVQVHCARVEDVVPTLSGIDALTARGLAPLPQLLLWGKRLIEAGTLGVFLKGEEFRRESVNVPPAGFAVEAVPSLTHPAARILLVRRPADEAEAE